MSSVIHEFREDVAGSSLHWLLNKHKATVFKKGVLITVRKEKVRRNKQQLIVHKAESGKNLHNKKLKYFSPQGLAFK